MPRRTSCLPVALVGQASKVSGRGRWALRARSASAPTGLLCLACLALAPTGVAAQGATPDLSEEWRWVDFGAESGLPEGNVRELVNGGGTVWVRTDRALGYYDGFVWTRAGPALGLPMGAPTSLASAPGDSVVVVIDGVVYRGGLRGFAVVPVSLPPPFQSFKVARVLPDTAGDFYLTVFPNRALGYDLQSALFHASAGVVRRVGTPGPLSRADGLWRTRSGRIWIDTWAGFAVQEGARWRLVEDLATVDAAHRRITPVLVEDPSGVGVALRTFPVPEKGLWAWDGRGPVHRMPGEGTNPALSADAWDGSVWVIYDTGDVRVLENGVWRSMELPTSRRDGVDFIHFGDSGDLWLSSADGLHLFRASAFRWQRMRRPFPDARNRINAILVDRDTVTWLATEGGLVTYDTQGRETWIRSILGRDPDVGTGLAQDSSGQIWLTSGLNLEGALRWDGTAWHRFGPREGLDAGRIHSVFVDREGGVWFMALGRQTREVAGVYRLADGVVEDVTSTRHLPRGAAYAFAEGPDGTIWLGLEAGLARLRGNEVTLWGPEEGLGIPGNSEVFDVALDPRGRLWFCHLPMRREGLGYVDLDGAVHYVDVPGGPEGQRVFSVAVEASGTVWVGSDAGVARLGDGVWSLFDAGTGLGAEGVWPIVLRPGSLLIGTRGGGLVTLDLNQASVPPPRVRIDAHAEGDVATLRWSVFAYWGETPGSRVQTRLRIDGGDWSEWSTQRTWAGRQPSSGVHTVEVEAAGLFGQTTDPPARATFRVVPPLVRRPGFLIPTGTLLAALLSVGTVASIRRRRDRAALLVGEERWRSLVESAPEAIGIYDVRARRFVLVNERASELLGFPKEELLGGDPLLASARTLQDGTPSLSAARDAAQRALAGETVVLPWLALAAGGVEIPCELRISALSTTDRSLLRVSLIDIRERLASEARRAELEEQLRQALKLEAVGKLTAGIAHDFNNLLAATIGNLGLLTEGVALAPEDDELVQEALAAANRGAQLTQRLLAFSKKQPLAPRILDIPGLFQSAMAFLRRSLGGTIDIDVRVPAEVWPLSADANQLEHAIFNLALNARDAMSGSGRLVLEATNVEVDGGSDLRLRALAPGRYVRISVTDDGPGMPPVVLEHAFEPFFTTKPVGSGSGLGLSMVYGFASQSGGIATIDSAVGSGTTVSLYLPCVSGAEREPGEPPPQHVGIGIQRHVIDRR